MDIRDLKKKGNGLEPIMRVGKNGINDNVIQDIKDHLRKKKLIKVKFLNSFPDKDNIKTIAEDICQKTGASLVSKIGFTIVIYKR